MFFRLNSSGKPSYLQTVQSFRVGKRVHRRVIANFGRYDRPAQSGARELLLARCDGTNRRGPGFRFDVERTELLSVLHRLCSPGSDHSALRFARDQAVVGVRGLQLQHPYRAVAWLGEELSANQQHQRCVKDRLKDELFARHRHLFSGLDLVFFDTTLHYFHGRGGQSQGRRAFSKDCRPQCRQMIVGLVLDEQVLPVCTEIWLGNVANVTALVSMAERLRWRFGLGSVCLVTDRGMISQAPSAACLR